MEIASWMRREMHGLFNFLLPPACVFCLERLNPPDPDFFCHTCTDEIPPLQQPCCPRCALPYPAETGPGHLCQACLREKTPFFSGVIPIGPYDGLLREAIHRFKYRNGIDLDRPLGSLLAARIETSGLAFDRIVPVPLHRSKQRQRTYNQSDLIGRRVAAKLDLPYDRSLLVRNRPDPPQKEMTARTRTRNVKGAFSLSTPLKQDESILLIDDVMTTGATARECARVLLAGGADSVHVAILARAPLR